ncbi:hypothetical protein [Bacillus sp. FJAT-45350]|uniref:hypothetical protein n=1 Tax=Bacillus sp. FJAT-45350 TaxID=2011014 RepID=UPI000BB99309|nr:hypothetical protein [Bacillus sp. FJAT-45350]
MTYYKKINDCDLAIKQVMVFFLFGLKDIEDFKEEQKVKYNLFTLTYETITILYFVLNNRL